MYVLMTLDEESHYTISREDMLKGIKRCLENADLILERTSKILTRDEFFSQYVIIQRIDRIAFGLYTYAMEEYGKALLLKNYLKEDKNEYVVDRTIFGTHKKKFDEAKNNLPEECSSIWPSMKVTVNINTSADSIKIPITSKDYVTLGGGLSGTFEDISNSPPPEDIIETDFEIRKDCFFVDWDKESNCWKEYPKIHHIELEKAIKKLREIIHEMISSA